MNHQARQFDNTKGTLQAPCIDVPACLAHWPEKGQTVTTTDHPIISNDFDFYALTTKTYDRFDRLLTVTDAFNKTIKYAYDANGNRGP